MTDEREGGAGPSRNRRWLPILLGALGCAIVAFASWKVAPLLGEDSAYSTLGNGVDDVSLVDNEGRAVRWSELNGAPRALFFGFTHCPEVCPVTIAALSASLARIGPKANALRVAFVTVDPARDTPAALHDYLSSFGPQFHGYSGNAHDIDRIVNAFRAHYEKEPPDEYGNYNVNHTAIVYLINANGRVVDMIGYGSPPDRMKAQLRALVGAPAGAGQTQSQSKPAP